MTAFRGVRRARPDEEDALYDLLVQLHAENGLFRLDEAKSRQTIRDMLDPNREGIVGVIDGPNGLEGSIGLWITSWYYTNDPHLAEFWNFVRPDCRRSTHARRLIEFGKWCSEALGIPLHIGIVTTKRAEAKQRLYRRQLKHVGGYYMWGVTPRLGGDIEALATKQREAEQIFDEMRGAAKNVVNGDTKRRSGTSRQSADAMEKLRRIVNKAEAVFTDGPLGRDDHRHEEHNHDAEV